PSFRASRVRRSSPGLSSTSRISTGLFSSTIDGFLLMFGQREDERASFAELRFDADMAAVALDYLLDDRQADAGARVLALVVQALEHHEDALEVLRLDADAVVLDAELVRRPEVLETDVDARLHRGRAELERVAHQVLKELRELHLVGRHRGHRVVRDRGARLLDR